jgi:hypothetical protein
MQLIKLENWRIFSKIIEKLKEFTLELMKLLKFSPKKIVENSDKCFEK